MSKYNADEGPGCRGRVDNALGCKSTSEGSTPGGGRVKGFSGFS